MYFACHPDDLFVYLDDFSAGILQIMDCSIWYETEPEALSDALPDKLRAIDEIKSHLFSMDLVIFLVTADLLTKPSRAMQYVLPLALKQYIHVIPVVMEKGFKELIFYYFGDIQYVDMSDTGADAVHFSACLEPSLRYWCKEPENQMIGEGGYVFLSHSHDDIRDVRRFRNILEENGMDPLCFYLRCLEDDTEIFNLIKREIDARKQFVFIESENSRNSRWVTREREYVKNCGNKIIHTISLDEIRNSLNETANKILFSLRIFISFRKRDHALMQPILDELMKQDFQVFIDDFLTPGESQSVIIKDKIIEACAYGAFVILLSESSLEQCYQMLVEYPLAVQCGGLIIPVWMGNCPWDTVKGEFRLSYPWLDSYQMVDGQGDPYTAVQKIVKIITDHGKS